MKNIYLKQHDQRDCAATCLSMICTYYGLKYKLSKYRELTKTDQTGVNLYGLIEASKQLGFECQALSGSREELLRGLHTQDITFPFIAHIVSDVGFLHYVVIYKIHNNKFIVGDPAKGKCKIDIEKFFSMWTGYIITYAVGKDFQKGNYKKGSFTKFFSLLKGQFNKLFSVVIISVIITVIGIVGSFVFKIVIDNFTGTNYSSTYNKTSQSAIDILIDNFSALFQNFNVIFVALIGLYLLQTVIQIIRGKLIISVSKKIDMELSLSYYNHLIDLPISSISLRQTGEYLSRFSDVSLIRSAVSEATLTLLLDSIMAIACGIILCLQNSKLFAVSIIMIFLYFVLVILFRKPVEKNNRAVMENNAIVESYLKESIDGVETIKSACAEKDIKEKTKNKFDKFMNSVVKSNMVGVSQDSLAGAIELIGTIVILWIGFSMVINNIITIGSLITFYALLAYFTQPIKNLIELQPTIQTAIVAADRLNDILDMQIEHDVEQCKICENFNKISLINVNFRYSNNELTLKNINLNINKGEKVAIVGESGSGKTTLAKLLLKFYEPESGSIIIDDINIKDLSIKNVRKNIAYVNQNTFMFSDTIKNNLKLGNKNISDEEIKRICKICKADEFIKALPMGYDTPVDESGNNLSGGQKQRLAIARALLQKPQILIFDEATSNLDTITEAGIKQTIFNLNSDMTCIIIAHRLSTIKNCDKIYVMENGCIVEYGTHDELIIKNGTYKKLIDNQ